jgi:hypothetical protein
MKLFELRRTEDESGVSGTGTVAQGVIFDNGKCVLTWLTEYTSIAVYDDIETVRRIHGHNGKTKVVQIANLHHEDLQPLKENCAQDHVEGVGSGLKGTAKYLWDQREKFMCLFDPRLLGEGPCCICGRERSIHAVDDPYTCGNPCKPERRC